MCSPHETRQPSQCSHFPDDENGSGQCTQKLWPQTPLHAPLSAAGGKDTVGGGGARWEGFGL